MLLNSCAFNMFAKPVLACFWRWQSLKAVTANKCFLQNHGVVEVGRDFWRLHSPVLVLGEVSKGRFLRTVSHQVFTISKDGDCTTS